MATRTITISEIDGHFTVMQDGRMIDELCWDEALGVVAQLLIPGPLPKYNGGLLTAHELKQQAVRRGYPKPDEPEETPKCA